MAQFPTTFTGLYVDDVGYIFLSQLTGSERPIVNETELFFYLEKTLAQLFNWLCLIYLSLLNVLTPP